MELSDKLMSIAEAYFLNPSECSEKTQELIKAGKRDWLQFTITQLFQKANSINKLDKVLPLIDEFVEYGKNAAAIEDLLPPNKLAINPAHFVRNALLNDDMVKSDYRHGEKEYVSEDSIEVRIYGPEDEIFFGPRKKKVLEELSFVNNLREILKFSSITEKIEFTHMYFNYMYDVVHLRGKIEGDKLEYINAKEISEMVDKWNTRPDRQIKEAVDLINEYPECGYKVIGNFNPEGLRKCDENPEEVIESIKKTPISIFSSNGLKITFDIDTPKEGNAKFIDVINRIGYETLSKLNNTIKIKNGRMEERYLQ